MTDAKLLSEATNYAVVHLPGRAFPGVVFQGDSLNILISDLERVSNERDPSEREATLRFVIENLREAQARYETVLKAEGMSLPYQRP